MVIIRQKTYGINDSLKKGIRNIRMKLAESIDRSIEKDLIQKRSLESEGLRLSNKLHKIPETTKLAEKEISSLKNNGVEVNQDYNLLGNDGRNIIYVTNPVSSGELSHEKNHIKNAKGENGILAKFINKRGQTDQTLGELEKIDALGANPQLGIKDVRERLTNDSEALKEANEFLESSKLSDSLSRLSRGGLLLQDERNASRFGLRELRNKGLSPEVMKLEQDRQRAANKSYKKAISASSKIPVRNIIQVPEKRGEFKFKRLTVL